MSALPELKTQVLDRTLRESRAIEKELENSYAYINCDLRYFNFDFLIKDLGHFDSNLGSKISPGG